MPPGGPSNRADRRQSAKRCERAEIRVGWRSGAPRRRRQNPEAALCRRVWAGTHGGVPGPGGRAL